MQTIECKGKIVEGNKIYILDDIIKNLNLQNDEEVKVIIIKDIEETNISIEEDSLFNIKSSGYSGCKDLATEHDKYLYGAKNE